MITDTSNKIIQYLKQKESASAKELGDYLGISRQALFKHFNKLIAKNAIYKIGRPPKVAYLLKTKEEKIVYKLNFKDKEIIKIIIC